MSAIVLGSWIIVTSALGQTKETSLPSTLDLTALRGVATQHDGRWPPLDTVARDLVKSVTGSERFGGRDSVLLLLAWSFAPEVWSKEPLIAIGNAELRRELELTADKTTFSYAELISHPRIRTLVEQLSRIERGRKMDPLESKVSDIHDKLVTLDTIFRGQAIRWIPDAGDAMAAWKPVGAPGAGTTDLTGAWNALQTAFLADDAKAFAEASARLSAVTAALPAAFRPAPEVIQTELHYNALHPFGTAWKVMLVGVVLAAVALAVRSRWFDALAFVGLLAGFGVLTYGLSLRWQIAGRIPASNMFESLLFLSWGMGAFAIISILAFRDRLIPLTASGMGALALVLANVLPTDSFIRPIAPVLLDTVWMSIHVPIIMVSYSVLALAVLVAHVQLIAMSLSPRRTQLSLTVDGLHYWYVHVGSILLTAGIITGSMWAASSWGRYWGWDPKEVWSLVALLGYLTILHVRIDAEKIPAWACFVALAMAAAIFAIIAPKLSPLTGGKILGLVGALGGMGVLVLARGRFATAVKSILCFWLIIMTYVGVNYVLGIGLHSYGFGTGAVARSMFLAGGMDLGFVGLCTLIYLLRRGWRFQVSAPLGRLATG
ncbi:MAG: cytochrome c biogenesis protein CcsA [Planctomycetota bacterium]